MAFADKQNGPEVPKGKPGTKEQLPPNLEAIKKKEAGTKGETVEKTSSIKREVLQEMVGPDQETSERILKIDAGKELKEQQAEYDRMELVAFTMLAKLFEAGYKKEVLQVFESFRSINIDPKIPLNGPEKTAMAKLREIAGKPLSPLFKDVNMRWKDLIDRAYGNYESAAKTKKIMFGPEKKAETNSVWDYVKQNKNTIITTVAVAAGAYGIYKIFFDDDKTSASGEKKKFWQSKEGKIGVLLGLLTVGSLIGPEKIKEWVSKGFSLTADKIERFVKLIGEGRYKDAFASLFEGGDENMENYGKIAQIVSKETGVTVTDTTVKHLANAKYTTFISLAGKSKAFASTILKDLPGAGKMAGMFFDTQEQIAQEQAVRKYLETHKSQIDALHVSADATLFEVMARLNSLDVKVLPKAAEEPKNEVGEAVDTGLGEIIAVGDQAVKELKQEFKDKPNFNALLSKYDKKWSTIFWHPIDFTNELLSACKKDGVPVAIGAGKILLFNGYKFVTFTSAKTLFNAGTNLIKAPFSDKIGWSDSIGEYMIGASPFIVIGASKGVIDYMRGQSPVEILKGAGRGAIFPVEVARMHVVAGQRIYRTAAGGSFAVREWIASTEAKPKIIEAEAKFYAEVAEKYSELYYAKQKGSKITLQKFWGQLTSQRVEELRVEFLRKFTEAYNKLEPKIKLQMDEKNPQSIADTEKFMNEYMAEQRAAGKAAPKKGIFEFGAPAVVEPISSEPTHLGSENEGQPNASHKYKFEGQEVTLTEKEIAQRAAEIAKAETTADNGPKAGEEKLWHESNWNKAIRQLAAEKVTIPTPVEGKANTWKLGGQEFVLTAEEISARAKAANISEAEAAKVLTSEKALSHVTIQEVRITNGVYEYKIGGEWIKSETPTEPAKLAEIKSKFETTLREKGTTIDFQKFAMEAKALKYFGVLEKTMGTAAAVLIIYHLETAKDKRKAVVETAVGLGTFMGGMKLTDWQIGSKIAPTSPGKIMMRTAVDLAGGIAACFGFTEPISKIVMNFYKDIPAAYGVSKELADIFEKAATRQVVRTVLMSAENGILKKAVMKIGLEAVGRMFEKKIGGALLKKVGEMAAKQGFKQVLKALGWKGVTTAALLADDATVIGVLDDIIAVGLIVWMGFDIYDIVKLIANASELNTAMAERSKHPMQTFEIKDPKSRAELQQKLIPYGKTVATAHELGDEVLFDMLRTLPQTVIEIKRQGMSGKELWTLNKGEAVGIALVDDSGKVLCQVSDEDAGKIDSALANMKVDESKAA